MTNQETKLQDYNVSNDPIFQEFCLERNLTETSRQAYHSALTLYCNYNKMTLQELINEADNEEEERIRAKNRSITRRLKNFRTSQSENIQHSSLLDYMGKIKSLYRHNMIEIPYIPPLKHKPRQVMYEDIPHKEHLIETLERVSNLKHRAMILFMASSGTARQEIANLTIKDFIEATQKYHDNNTTNITNILHQLKPQKDIIPLWKMTRQKTGYRYYTCNTPEATNAIIKYLLNQNQNKLTLTTNLFGMTPKAITTLLNRLNTKLNYPYINGHSFIHPHSFRKYHADIIGDYDLTNILQGRKPSPIREAYFKQNPTRIREEYMKHVSDLTLQKSKVVTIESDEVKALKREHQAEIDRLEKETKERVQAIEDKIALFLELQQK